MILGNYYYLVIVAYIITVFFREVIVFYCKLILNSNQTIEVLKLTYFRIN